MKNKHNPNQNHLLAALAEAEFRLLLPHMELIPLALGDVLYESGEELNHLYFPTTAVISLHYLLVNGKSSEIANVGNEGVLGVSLLMGGKTTPGRAIVSMDGYGYRIPGSILVEEFHRNGQLQEILLRYVQALITQMSQMAVCNRHHSVEEQVCRWLLLMTDRVHSNELAMTQELIANMLGVRREGVTEAAGKLQDYGYICYRRGHITVLNRKGLEERVCECYDVVKKEYSRLLSDACQR